MRYMQTRSPVLLSSALYFSSPCWPILSFEVRFRSHHLDDLFRLICPRFLCVVRELYVFALFFRAAIPGFHLILPFVDGKGMLPFLVWLS